MEQYAGIDVSLDSASMCIVDAQGKIVKEAKVACEPEALIACWPRMGHRWRALAWRPGTHASHFALKAGSDSRQR